MLRIPARPFAGNSVADVRKLRTVATFYVEDTTSAKISVVDVQELERFAIVDLRPQPAAGIGVVDVRLFAVLSVRTTPALRMTFATACSLLAERQLRRELAQRSMHHLDRIAQRPEACIKNLREQRT